MIWMSIQNIGEWVSDFEVDEKGRHKYEEIGWGYKSLRDQFHLELPSTEECLSLLKKRVLVTKSYEFSIPDASEYREPFRFHYWDVYFKKANAGEEEKRYLGTIRIKQGMNKPHKIVLMFADPLERATHPAQEYDQMVDSKVHAIVELTVFLSEKLAKTKIKGIENESSPSYLYGGDKSTAIKSSEKLEEELELLERFMKSVRKQATGK